MKDSHEVILKQFDPLFANTGGIDSWLTPETDVRVFERLSKLPAEPLTHTHLHQLLVLSHEAGPSEGFFQYYWLDARGHPYDVRSVEEFDEAWLQRTDIASLSHLRWGLYRFYVDALLYFGNVRSAYRYLRDLSFDELKAFFASRRLDTDRLQARGQPMPITPVAKDDRYLISEMACKALDATPDGAVELRDALAAAFDEFRRQGGRRAKIGDLLEATYCPAEYADSFVQLRFSADEILDEVVEDRDDIDDRFDRIAARFLSAREVALANTEIYLSVVNDLDVYVATSMRTRDDFRKMAAACESVFSRMQLVPLNLRYFDPTLSAARGHEDKGLLECLMVKCAKVLVYFAGTKESFGKDAEAAMALSLGKPVIFYCDDVTRREFYRDVHPLSRLIDFNTGVAVGAIVTSSLEEVVELLRRVFTNDMRYRIEQRRPGHLRLREDLTDSVVRLQTSDRLLTETFWNYYHRPRVYGASVPSLHEGAW